MKDNEIEIRKLVDSIEIKINDILNLSKYYISNKPPETEHNTKSHDNFVYNNNLSQYKNKISDDIETIIENINKKQLKLKSQSYSNLNSRKESETEEGESIILTKENDFVILPTIDSALTNKNKNIVENMITIEYTNKSLIIYQIQSNIIQISLIGLNKNNIDILDQTEKTKIITEFDMEENKIEGYISSQIILPNKNNLKIFNFDDNQVNQDNYQNTSILETDVIINQVKESNLIKNKDFNNKLKITKLSDIFYYDTTDLKPFTINVSFYVINIIY